MARRRRRRRSSGLGAGASPGRVIAIDGNEQGANPWMPVTIHLKAHWFRLQVLLCQDGFAYAFIGRDPQAAAGVTASAWLPRVSRPGGGHPAAGVSVRRGRKYFGLVHTFPRDRTPTRRCGREPQLALTICTRAAECSSSAERSQRGCQPPCLFNTAAIDDQ